jgi:hypothetical protein
MKIASPENGFYMLHIGSNATCEQQVISLDYRSYAGYFMEGLAYLPNDVVIDGKSVKTL